MEKDGVFSTRDIGLAATLITLKFFSIGTDYVQEGLKNSGVGYFKFESTPELQEVKQKFIQGQLLVEPKAFLNNIHTLKSEISNMYNNPTN